MGVAAFTYIVILLLVGIGVEWLYWTYAYSPLRAIQSSPAASPRQALRLALRRSLSRFRASLLFTVAAIGASAAFSWPRGVQELVVAATLLLLVLRLAWIAHRRAARARPPRLRLVPVADERAGWLAAVAMTVVCLLALGVSCPACWSGWAAQATWRALCAS